MVLVARAVAELSDAVAFMLVGHGLVQQRGEPRERVIGQGPAAVAVDFRNWPPAATLGP